MKNNSVRLIGYVGEYPKITISKDGIKRASIRVATHDESEDKHDTPSFSTVWHEVIAWNKTAEYAERSFVKGSRIMVDGMLSYRRSFDESGNMRHYADVKAISLKNLDR